MTKAIEDISINKEVFYYPGSKIGYIRTGDKNTLDMYPIKKFSDRNKGMAVTGTIKSGTIVQKTIMK